MALFEAMKLDNIGIVGQSRGALAAVMSMEELAHVKQLKAVVALDGGWGHRPVKPILPTLVLGSAGGNLEKDIKELITDPYSSNVEFKQFNVAHHEFSDVALFKKTGEENFHERYSQIVLKFLTRYLHPPKL